ncbi:primosomal replication protein [Pseudoalteromonas sp. McH1-7]|uniref:Primosomal replication protein N n=1 Tax=Pseudoalteromonas peptidolytica F12-50-A1 TaxID=1315280 RepID=A0A8I0T3W3_9GAMM|nr:MULTISPECIES: primosomal replication protein [Pseudoalteromonas]MBE0345662.1 primosomal replication protein N'' [Pseudoalteromonas peptidolytica F12-50-A1]MDW7547751.1 primosomal replication protein [Pseudoalteromonas peptidolytica]NLR14285.1 primosomal protein [Pseudoalteromonas peptidolytica]NUZ11313.1 primosomal replication protein [Pseudoalteromonas sp. McH1-7]RRS08681.1 primosomal protein [Pseudoalteromonas sp. J010]
MSVGLIKLEQQISRLKQQAVQFDAAKWFDKNRYMQAQPSLFDTRVFRTKSLKLSDYVDEISEAMTHLPPSEQRHAFAFAIERIGSQMEAVLKVLKSTPVWAKENKLNTPKKAKVYKKAVQKIMQSSHELYQELSQNHEFERRLQEMIDLRRLQMDKANGNEAAKLNAEILALHARLGRCRKAITATEQKIQEVEKSQNR